MERNRKVRIVLNPTAGRGAGGRLRAEVAGELAVRGVLFDLHETTAPGHAAELAAAAAAAGEAVIVAVGGDGTIHEIVNGLMRCAPDARPALGLIPVGTGNDLVKVVAGTRTRAEAYDTIAHGSAVPLDAGRASWAGGREYFVNAMGTGIDVEVVRQIRGLGNLPGAAVYVLGLAKALAKYRPLRLRVTIDGATLDRRFMMAAVTNGCCVGGAFQLSPGASPNDGLLDVCLVDELTLAGSALLAPRFLRGSHTGHRAVQQQAAKQVTIEAPDGTPLFFQLDGELREPVDSTRLVIDVLPAALSVLTAVSGSRRRPPDAYTALEVS